MSRFGGEPVVAPLPGPCECPGSPHDRDEVYLLPRLTFDGGAAADRVITRHLGPDMDTSVLADELIRVFLEHQVSGWNLLGDDGAPLPYSAALLLSDREAAVAVGDAADALYAEALLAPLQAAVQKSLPAGPTAPSTSPRTRTAGRPRKR